MTIEMILYLIGVDVFITVFTGYLTWRYLSKSYLTRGDVAIILFSIIPIINLALLIVVCMHYTIQSNWWDQVIWRRK